MSSVSDNMCFALMLWNKGTYQAVQILKAEYVELLRQAQFKVVYLGARMALRGRGGAVVIDEDETLILDCAGDFWWSGFYGAIFFENPSTSLVMVAMSQYEPSPYADRPISIYLLSGLTFIGHLAYLPTKSVIVESSVGWYAIVLINFTL